ncbi:CoA transferase [Tersicoccus solisilvae]|uniref:CoA transferase n=1 Tax=Tersicoccus solisilvae TaxID=1882339 RepID=UPI00166F54B5|nr:CoA transferase [Tersicoccus solisilvae]
MTRQSHPLVGVTVVSLAINLPGPLAVGRLASLGASVTKVEPPSGDPLRAAAPAWYRDLHRDVTVVTLDLKREAARLEELLTGADVLVTAMRAEAAARLGLPELVARLGLAHVEIVGHDDGRPGHDLTFQAEAGLLSSTDAELSMPVAPVADLLGAERAVSAALVALRLREVGAPAHQRVVLAEAAHDAAAALRHGLTGPGTPLGGGLEQYGLYATADGHVAVAAIEPHFAARLTQLVGGTRAELTARFAEDTSAAWERFGRERDLPIVTVHQISQHDQPTEGDT